jgi:hypothetical protein
MYLNYIMDSMYVKCEPLCGRFVLSCRTECGRAGTQHWPFRLKGVPNRLVLITHQVVGAVQYRHAAWPPTPLLALGVSWGEIAASPHSSLKQKYVEASWAVR